MFKGIFHYVINYTEATKLEKKNANKLLRELRHPENYEILRVRER